MTTPELSRILPIERVGNGLDFDVAATPAECAALAARMGLEAIASLACRFTLKRARIRGEIAAVLAEGRLQARITQSCVVSLDPFDADIAEDFTVRFVPEGSEREDVDLEDEDEIPYTGNAIDLGEAAAEQLALALDPFPRKPGASLPEDTAPDTRTPFAVLGRLRQ